MKLTFAWIAGVAVILLGACTSVPPARFDASDARTSLPVAMVSMESDVDPRVNRDRIGRFIELIAAEQPEVRLICFGEASLGWYWTGAGSARYHRSIAESLDGPTVSMVRRLAAENGVYVLFGFTEAADGRIYNAALIVDDRGEIVAHRRKSHFVPYDTLSGFTRGERTVTTATIDTVKVAMLICNDFNSLRYQRAIHADADIKVLLLPHATANLQPDFWERYRYNYKGLWMLSAQRYGQEQRRFYYGSWILDPNGYMVAHAESGPGYFVYRVPIR